ncbi:hypothetical protein [Pedobacter cryoconitis]|uniref:Uncharacterized protein n=1 Tax=Pedobacter cryoconitis TaxID=188932 RepID=A0A327SR15_9SPHI|nr:hypothetical protein [Pedobacter cryoconitis]RAJ28157.1 hypothetical protein LY11_03477 [Pedobacter cryoconitis]
MYQQIKYTIGQLAAKGIKPLAVFLLLLICLLSSCAVRKGIQSFFSDTVSQSAVSNKLMKSLWGRPDQLIVEKADCLLAQLNSSTDEPIVKQSVLRTSLVMLFAFILPGFILSLLVSFKKQTELPRPESKLRWPVIPLFLQNSLLLI